MDILTHITIGAAIGAGLAAYKKGNVWRKCAVILSGALGGALPDVDAISMWSRFDSTFGRLFNLRQSGKVIYSSKLWYSHHAFMHSLFAGVLFAFLLFLFIYIIKQRFKHINYQTFKTSFVRNRLIAFSFLGGFIAHLFCDMVTPSSAWGGVNLFWPSSSYIGGWGNIWWWNNYDIFLIALSVVLLNVLLLIVYRYTRAKRYFSLLVIFLGFVLIIMQIKTRGYNFNYVRASSSQFQQFEAKSKDIQQQILGKKLYKRMRNFDNKLKINF